MSRRAVGKPSEIEEFFKRKCILNQTHLSPETSEESTQVVFLEESTHTKGVGRLVLKNLAKTLALVKGTHVIHVQIDGATKLQSEVHTNLNYSQAIWSTESQKLVQAILQDVKKIAIDSNAVVVVVIDCVSTLLQVHTMPEIGKFFKDLQAMSQVGAVLARYNRSMHPQQVSYALQAFASVFLLVETRASIAAYPLLSKESKRVVPPTMTGMLLMIRKTKNGKSTEATEYFTIDINEGDPSKSSLQLHAQVLPDANVPTEDSTPNASLIASLGADVSFNLSISQRDHATKQKVTLPYQHNVETKNSANDSKPAFFIDEDDPDWDDDDLDDDLDI